MTLRNDADLLKRVLGRERAAASTYEKILNESAADPPVWDFQKIAENHRRAVGSLFQRVQDLGERADGDRSDISWSGIKKSMAKIHEDRGLLLALREAELRNLDECERALRQESRYPLSRMLLKEQVVPMLQRHVDVLNEYLARLH